MSEMGRVGLDAFYLTVLGQRKSRVDGRCPRCGGHELYLATTRVTCSRPECPDPMAASDLLARGPEEVTVR